MRRLAAAGLFAGMLGVSAQAADIGGSAVRPDIVTLSASLGHLNGEAKERVYRRNGAKLSELVWDMQHALVLNGGVSVHALDWLTVYGNVSVGLAADNTMDDYDWVGTPRPDKPNLHSWHDDTELDHYYTLDAGVSLLLLETGFNRFSVLGGFKYTDVKWSAYGGCYDYEYLDRRGCFDDDLKVISYRQSLPALYGGLGYAGSHELWSLALEGRLGMTLSGAEADDDHWLRNLNFVDHLKPAPYLALNGKAGYAVSEKADVFASVAFDKFFEMRGETTYRETDTGFSVRSDYDSGGANLYTLNIAIGVDYRF
jgi:outer membrane protease